MSRPVASRVKDDRVPGKIQDDLSGYVTIGFEDRAWRDMGTQRKDKRAAGSNADHREA
jgi:hypothetical protein